MKRRFLQFSLRGLLGVAALVCLALGGWHLLETYGTRLDVNARIGEPILVKVRYFCPFGPSICNLEVGHDHAGDVAGFCQWNRVRRSWLCFYSKDAECDIVDQPCQLRFDLRRYENFTSPGRIWILKEKVVDVK